MFEVSRKFNAFYKACPVKNEPDENIRAFRLLLTARTKSMIEILLNTLAIEWPDHMQRNHDAD